MPKLTKRTVDALRSEPDQEVFAWDSELRGFGARLRPNGAGSFIIQYRNGERRTRRLTLGSLHVLTPEQARGLARDKLGRCARARIRLRSGRRFAHCRPSPRCVTGTLEQAEAGRLLGRKRRPVAASTLPLDRSRIETHVKPLIGSRTVRGLSVADLENFQADVAVGKTAKGGVTTDGTGVAGRTLGMLHTIFEQATRWGVIEANPARGARRSPTTISESADSCRTRSYPWAGQ